MRSRVMHLVVSVCVCTYLCSNVAILPLLLRMLSACYASMLSKWLGFVLLFIVLLDGYAEPI